MVGSTVHRRRKEDAGKDQDLNLFYCDEDLNFLPESISAENIKRYIRERNAGNILPGRK